MKNILLGVALSIATTTGFAHAQPVPAAKPTLRLCTGSESGNYYFAGHVVRKNSSSADVQVISTGGSVDNLDGLVNGRCDAAFVQNDAFKLYSQTNPRIISSVERAASMYKEYVHLICNRRACVFALDLPKDITVAVGNDGSGSSVTWQSIVQTNKEAFKTIRTDARSGIRAINAVADGTDVQCMMFVAGLGSPLIKADAKALADKIVIVPISADFDQAKDPKGRPLYSYEEIKSDTYGPLMPSGTFFSSIDAKTIAVDAVMLVSTSWINANEATYDRVLRSVNASMPEIHQRVYNNIPR